MLEGLEPRDLGAAVLQARALGDLGEEPDRAEEVLGVAVEQLVEALFLGHEELDDLVASHASPSSSFGM